LEEILHFMDPQIQQTGAEIILDGSFPTVVSDRIKLKEVFINLIGNAIKYSFKEGSAPPKIPVGSQDQGGWFEFYVQDNGIGISPEFHEQIFEMFRRLHTESEYEGTGMGLYLVKKIVQSQGGRVWVVSNPDLTPGSTFYFTLPKTQSV